MKLVKLATSALAIASVVLSAGIASAQTVPAKGMNGSYIGAGVSAGVTNGGQNEDAALLGGNVQGRYAIPNAPVSARGAVLFGGNAAAIMPMVTYDAPVSKNTNVYLGGGYSFVTDEGRSTQLGNKNAPVVTLGAESEVAPNTVIYGDAKWGIDAYKDSAADALSLQAGVGYRF
jgi:Outer membrane protein beta-barrel domain